MSDKPAFIEKQYLGREFIPITIRLVLAMFCFAAYFFTDERERNGNLLIVVGFGIIIISIIMGFLLHFRTRILTVLLKPKRGHTAGICLITRYTTCIPKEPSVFTQQAMMPST
jgi:hypothetical protein